MDQFPGERPAKDGRAGVKGMPLDAWCRTELSCQVEAVQYWSTRRHTFSHFHLDITPAHLLVGDGASVVCVGGEARAWYDRSGYNKLGVPALEQHLRLMILGDDKDSAAHR